MKITLKTYLDEEVTNVLKRLFDEIAELTGCDKKDIRYLNGNDSTHFDWKVNGRLCEFLTPQEWVYVYKDVIKIFDRFASFDDNEREYSLEWFDEIDVEECAGELIEYEETLRIPDFDDVYWNVSIDIIEERMGI